MSNQFHFSTKKTGYRSKNKIDSHMWRTHVLLAQKLISPDDLIQFCLITVNFGSDESQSQTDPLQSHTDTLHCTESETTLRNQYSSSVKQKSVLKIFCSNSQN